MTIKGLKNKVNLVIIKTNINKELSELKRYSRRVNYIPIGQRLTVIDPYGEENWDN